MTDLQEKILSLLKIIDSHCRKHEIDYYITGGSLIGAIRHKGFIPWDDDADIIMSRGNWEKFYETMQKELPENKVIMTQDNNIDLAVPVNHFVDTKTTDIYRFHLTNPQAAGILVDVLIMDPVPDTEEAKEAYREALIAHTELTNLYYQSGLRYGKQIDFDKYWDRIQSEGKRKVIDEIDAKAFSFTEEESQLYAQRFVSAIHFWPKEYYGKPKYVPFEDTNLPIPQRAGDCLSIGYDDDWMYIPQQGPDKSSHEFVVRSMQTPYTFFLEDFEEHIDRPQMMNDFLQRKRLWVRNIPDKFKSEILLDAFAIEYVKMLYEKKLAATNLRDLVEAEDYQALEDFFDEYINVQVGGGYLGSSSLSNWKAWYYKSNPQLVDIGDYPLYAACLLFFKKRRLAIVGKLLKARKLIEREFSPELAKIQTLYEDIRKIRTLIEQNEYDAAYDMTAYAISKNKANIILDTHLVELLSLRREEPSVIADKCDDLMSKYSGDAEILYYKAEALFNTGNITEAEDMLGYIVGNTTNGIILLKIKQIVEKLLAQEASERTLKLYYSVRVASGENFEEESEDDISDDEELTSARNDELLTYVTERLSTILNSKELSEADMKSALKDFYVGVISLFSTQKKRRAQGLTEREIEELSSEDFQFSTEYDLELNDSEQSDMSDDDLEIDCLKSSDKDTDYAMSEVQKKRFELLEDLDQICRKNDIDYILAGHILRQAAMFHKYIDREGDIDIFMTPENVKKFISAVNKEDNKKRYIDCMLTNPEYNRFGLRYCDANSLDFYPTQGGERFGIYIRIELLRKTPKSSLIMNLDRFLERGWEANVELRRVDRTILFSKKVVSIMCSLLGKKKVAKLLFNRAIRKHLWEDETQVFKRLYWQGAAYYPAWIFEHGGEIELEGKKFKTALFFDRYLRLDFGDEWREREFIPKRRNHARRIVDANISSKEFLDNLNKSGINRYDIRELWYKTNENYSQIKILTKRINHYWQLMEATGARYIGAELAKPKRKELKQIYEAQDSQKMLEEIRPIYSSAERLRKKGIGLNIDPELDRYVDYIYKDEEKFEEVAEIKSLREKQNWKLIEL